jgi:hypothetical protein
MRNEENEYPVPDPNRTMIHITNELNDTHKKNLSKRKLWTISLKKSWRSYKTQLTIKYKMHSRNTKTPQKKQNNNKKLKTQKQLSELRTPTNSKVKQRRL